VSIAEQIWKQLAADFRGDDDRTLPDIEIEPLSRVQVCEIYRWVRSHSEVYVEHGEPVFWDLVEQRDVPITAVDDPCERVMAGRAEPFRHGLSRLTVEGIEVPSLTVAVWPGRVSFDYRTGAEWGPAQLSALFEFLWVMQQIAPDATFSHFHEGCKDRTQAFDLAWHQYRQLRSGDTTV
jgi:hypothetical protein